MERSEAERIEEKRKTRDDWTNSKRERERERAREKREIYKKRRPRFLGGVFFIVCARADPIS